MRTSPPLWKTFLLGGLTLLHNSPTNVFFGHSSSNIPNVYPRSSSTGTTNVGFRSSTWVGITIPHWFHLLLCLQFQWRTLSQMGTHYREKPHIRIDWGLTNSSTMILSRNASHRTLSRISSSNEPFYVNIPDKCESSFFCLQTRATYHSKCPLVFVLILEGQPNDMTAPASTLRPFPWGITTSVADINGKGPYGGSLSIIVWCNDLDSDRKQEGHFIMFEVGIALIFCLFLQHCGVKDVCEQSDAENVCLRLFQYFFLPLAQRKFGHFLLPFVFERGNNLLLVQFVGIFKMPYRSSAGSHTLPSSTNFSSSSSKIGGNVGGDGVCINLGLILMKSWWCRGIALFFAKNHGSMFHLWLIPLGGKTTNSTSGLVLSIASNINDFSSLDSWYPISSPQTSRITCSILSLESRGNLTISEMSQSDTSMCSPTWLPRLRQSHG